MVLGLGVESILCRDGAPVDPDASGAFSLPRDEEEHAISVSAPRTVPWTAAHRADADGEYEVRLRRVRRGRRGASEPSETEPHSGGVLRDLDY